MIIKLQGMTTLENTSVGLVVHFLCFVYNQAKRSKWGEAAAVRGWKSLFLLKLH